MNQIAGFFAPLSSRNAMKSQLRLYLGILALLIFASCEQEITVDLPTTEPQIVVEGTIFQDQPPIIFLSWTQGYFEPLSFEALAELYIKDPNVVASISDGTNTYPLSPLCLSDLPEDLQEDVSEILGIPVSALQGLDLCAYTNLALLGVAGTEYKLEVSYQDYELTSRTKLPELVELDTLWFEIVSSLPDDSLGFIFANITDPDTAGNAYRWFAKRINHYPQWIEDEELRGQQKDGRYIAPLGSTQDDTFFNGLSFEFGYYRGTEPNSSKFDDNNEERGFFKRGDTVAVRGCTMDRRAYRFVYSLESQVGNQGSPFAIPSNLESNVEGGLGAFIGYGAVYDTVICQ